jgi:hypothetical protein
MGGPDPKNEDAPGKEFLKNHIWPEEDRHLFTSVQWSGGYRWFRSPNVVPLEQYRKRPPEPPRS